MKVSCVLLTTMLFLTGCGNWVTEASRNKAKELCKDNGGIKHLSIFVYDKAVCKNGAVYQRPYWFVKE